MSERTDGAVSVRIEDGELTIESAYGLVATLPEAKDAENQANAAHLAACWNAFEPGGLVSRMAEALASIANDDEDLDGVPVKDQERVIIGAMVKKALDALDEYNQAKGGE